ncbi:ABC transporter ATP-binding protein [Solibacillus daqui]|uniref:ABC transporter ATP-binding protein n=1 Tax=Solibacillus daqui TaxID=2912187 RepID=UPI002365B341|nr:phosphate ABC transporter ATP-binding protein [Solibacillus daqui]
MNENAIQFQHVCFNANDTNIINDLTATIYKGKITTLIGPSGAGKTTLLKLCNGLITATSGSIFIHNKPIEAIEPTTLRRSVGMALQSAPILKTTVYENLALPRKLQHKELTKEEACRYLRDVGLSEDFLLRDASDLSGGQKQKLSIARTLINESDILLLDEITSALDPKAVREIEDLIVTLNERFRVTIIWITHNIEQAEKLGHYTWMLKNGELIEANETNQLFHSINEIVRQFFKQTHD